MHGNVLLHFKIDTEKLICRDYVEFVTRPESEIYLYQLGQRSCFRQANGPVLPFFAWPVFETWFLFFLHYVNKINYGQSCGAFVFCLSFVCCFACFVPTPCFRTHLRRWMDGGGAGVLMVGQT